MPVSFAAAHPRTSPRRPNRREPSRYRTTPAPAQPAATRPASTPQKRCGQRGPASGSDRFGPARSGSATTAGRRAAGRSPTHPHILASQRPRKPPGSTPTPGMIPRDASEPTRAGWGCPGSATAAGPGESTICRTAEVDHPPGKFWGPRAAKGVGGRALVPAGRPVQSTTAHTPDRCPTPTAFQHRRCQPEGPGVSAPRRRADSRTVARQGLARGADSASSGEGEPLRNERHSRCDAPGIRRLRPARVHGQEGPAPRAGRARAHRVAEHRRVDEWGSGIGDGLRPTRGECFGFGSARRDSAAPDTSAAAASLTRAFTPSGSARLRGDEQTDPSRRRSEVAGRANPLPY
jgi:hypothetical protein